MQEDAELSFEEPGLLEFESQLMYFNGFHLLSLRKLVLEHAILLDYVEPLSVLMHVQDLLAFGDLLPVDLAVAELFAEVQLVLDDEALLVTYVENPAVVVDAADFPHRFLILLPRDLTQEPLREIVQYNQVIVAPVADHGVEQLNHYFFKVPIR